MKFIDFKKDDGFEDSEGCWHEDAASLLQCGILGFCGCGCPEENLDYIRVGLELIAEPHPKERSAWDAWWTDHEARVIAHHGNEQSKYFFYYWTDKEGLTEHGGSVPGWLTEKGNDLLLMLRGEKDERKDEDE